MVADAVGISTLFSTPITAGQKMVGVRGFELLTSCSQSRRATGLRYTPVKKRRPLQVAFFDQRFWPLILRFDSSVNWSQKWWVVWDSNLRPIG